MTAAQTHNRVTITDRSCAPALRILRKRYAEAPSVPTSVRYFASRAAAKADKGSDPLVGTRYLRTTEMRSWMWLPDSISSTRAIA